MKKELMWNVFLINSNSNELEQFNVFNNTRFYTSLKDIKKYIRKNKIDLTNIAAKEYSWINDSIRIAAQSAFWAKFEYECLVSPVFSAISIKELERLKQIDISKIPNSKICVNLINDFKIDIYNQLQLNWDCFVKYIIDNMKLIKCR